MKARLCAALVAAAVFAAGCAADENSPVPPPTPPSIGGFQPVSEQDAPASPEWFVAQATARSEGNAVGYRLDLTRFPLGEGSDVTLEFVPIFQNRTQDVVGWGVVLMDAQRPGAPLAVAIDRAGTFSEGLAQTRESPPALKPLVLRVQTEGVEALDLLIFGELSFETTDLALLNPRPPLVFAVAMRPGAGDAAQTPQQFLAARASPPVALRPVHEVNGVGIHVLLLGNPRGDSSWMARMGAVRGETTSRLTTPSIIEEVIGQRNAARSVVWVVSAGGSGETVAWSLDYDSGAHREGRGTNARSDLTPGVAAASVLALDLSPRDPGAVTFQAQRTTSAADAILCVVVLDFIAEPIELAGASGIALPPPTYAGTWEREPNAVAFLDAGVPASVLVTTAQPFL